MDHVIDAMMPHFEPLMDWFMEEQIEHQYKKLSDNPYYEEVKAMIDAMNILRKYLGWETMKLSQEIQYRTIANNL